MSSFFENNEDSTGALQFAQNNHPDVLSLFRSSSNSAAEAYLTTHLHEQTVASLPEGVTPGEGMRRLRSLREKVRLLREKKKQAAENSSSEPATRTAPTVQTENTKQQEKSLHRDPDGAIFIDSSSDEEQNENNAFNTILSFQTKDEIKEHIEQFDTNNEFISIGTSVQDNAAAEKTQYAIHGFRKESPWMRRSKVYSEHPTLALHQEIIDFVRMIEETESERICRLKIIENIQNIILEIDPTAEFQVYGSFPVNLMIPGSDVDILMKSRKINNKQKNKSFMFNLRRVLQSSGFVSQCVVITNAKVPIIKIQEKKTQHWFDLHVDFDNSKNVDIVVKYVKKRLEEYPALRYLVLVIKYFLKQRGVNDAATGGMSSFGVVLMCLSLLQQHDSAYDETVRKKTSLGHLLLDFFALYGVYFNYNKVAISCAKDGSYIPKEEAAKYIVRPSKFSTTGIYANRLVILDPLDRTNCVTFITSSIEMIRFSFANSFRLLTSAWEPQDSLLNRVIAADNVLFSRAIGLKDLFQDRSLNNIYGGKRKRNDDDGGHEKKRSKKHR